MNANGESLSGAEDFIEAEIEAAHMDSPAAEVQVRAALEKLPGIARLDISHGKISVRYDPTRTSEKHISEAVAAAGHPVEKIEVSRDEGHASRGATAPPALSDGE
ncbi:MAG: heavy-metal-associated domain-containing protein [Verrucomicrobiota bacterium]|nr:heavy-metal-associated domain-containing protein [Verrucomicrobiota bacterium]